MAYNEFAYFYDEFNGAADYDALYVAVKKALVSHGVQEGIVADLGCGTGELTLMLAQDGYETIGIDQSEEMLAVVRDKADQMELVDHLLLLKQDLLHLDLFGTIHAAVSTFDTFNHLPDLDTAIKNAAFFMEEGGVFLFDMNTPYKHKEILGQNQFILDGADAQCVWKNTYDDVAGKVQISITIHYHDTGEVFEESFYEYTYTQAEITDALAKYGFVLESVCDGETFGTLTPQSERFLFCAVKQYTQLGE